MMRTRRNGMVGRDGRETKWENNEREILIERATMGLGRDLLQRKVPRIHKDDSS